MNPNYGVINKARIRFIIVDFRHGGLHPKYDGSLFPGAAHALLHLDSDEGKQSRLIEILPHSPPPQF